MPSPHDDLEAELTRERGGAEPERSSSGSVPLHSPVPLPGEGSPSGKPPGEEDEDLLEAALHAGFGPFPLFAKRGAESVLEVLGESAAPPPRIRLRGPSGESAPSPGEAGPRVSRYEVLGEVARGGMGLVLRGRDVDLGREVAMKVLRGRHAANPEMIRRFLEEAQIAGQLQHPGVVPVYEIGLAADKRPFFTMKLVTGKTLEDLLRARPDPARDLSRLLGIFHQICQALAFAHASGVIHRDLKPSNVMVGAFGEVQVMDWGLAKVLARGGAEPGANSDPTEGGTDPGALGGTQVRPASLAGAVMGTPGYMSPEQARGEVENLDERTDVFALGAVLCEILTGSPPFVGSSADEIRRRAARRSLEDAFRRLDACGAEAELVGIAKRCLAPVQGDRPRDAGVVAKEVTAYLASVEERARASELAAAEARARESEARAREAEERRARRLTTALAASIVLAVALGGGGTLWIARERNARALRMSQAVAGALEESTLARGQARSAPQDLSKWEEALAAARRAEAIARTGGTDPDLRARVERAVADLEREVGEARAAALRLERDRRMAERLEEIRSQAGDDLDWASQDRAFAAAFRDYGIDLDPGYPTPPNLEFSTAESRDFATLSPSLFQTFFIGDGLRNDGATLQEFVVPPGATRLFLGVADGSGWNDNRGRFTLTVRGRSEVDVAVLATMSPFLAGQPTGSRSYGDSALEQSPLLVRMPVSPGEILRFAGVSGLSTNAPGNPQWPLVGPDGGRDQSTAPDLGISGFTMPICALLGVFLPEGASVGGARLDPEEMAARIRSSGIAGRLLVALDDWTRARRWSGGAAPAGWERLLSVAHAADWDTWRSSIREACHRNDLAAMRAAASSPQTADLPPESLDFLANSLGHAGDPEAAVSLYRIAQRRHPGDFWINFNFGHWLFHLQPPQWAEAYRLLTAALVLRPRSAGAWTYLSVVRRHLGDVDGAVEAGEEAVRFGPDRPEAHNALGGARRLKGDVDGAVSALRKAIHLGPWLAEAHVNLGTLLCEDRRDLDGGLAELQEAVRLRPSLATAHYNLGVGLEKKRDLDKAIEAYRAAAHWDSSMSEAFNNLGNLLRRKGSFDEAVPHLREATRLKPENSAAHFNLGLALRALNDPDGAIAEFQEVLRRQPDDPDAYLEIGNALSDKGESDEAIAAYRKAIGLRSDFPLARVNLGNVLRSKGEFDDAEAAYQDALRSDPRNVGALIGLGNVLASKKDWTRAQDRYREALLLEPENALAHYNLGCARMAIGELEEAAVAFRRAVEVEPERPEHQGNLGVALRRAGYLREALGPARGAVRLRPTDSDSHYRLGLALEDIGEDDDAIGEYEDSLRVRSDHPDVLVDLGFALERKGRFAEALDLLRRGQEAGDRTPGWNFPAADWIRECERMREFETWIPALVRGDPLPTSQADRVLLARVCRAKGLYSSSARLWEAVLEAGEEPPSTDQLFEAACAAALACAAVPGGSAVAGDRPPAHWRAQAIGWLRQALGRHSKSLEGRTQALRVVVRRALARWKLDPALASVRQEAGAAVPSEAERETLAALWDDVDRLLASCEGNP